MSMNNSVVVTNWLRAMVEAMPRGGKSIAANNLGISPSGLSKILTNPERAFDQKTINLLSWIELSKSEKYPPDQFPIVSVQPSGPIVIETRKNPAAGTEFFTWRLPTP